MALALGTLDETDVSRMESSDEALSFPLDVDVLKKLDGRMDAKMIGATDAGVVKQVVFGKPF